MALIEKIESAIIEINAAVFQKLGDAILNKVYANALMFVSEGSQFGKEKTIAGTPDTYIETVEECIFVEYSTNVSNRIGKLINDINKCVEVYKDLELIKSPKIILITNFKLNLKEQSKLREHSAIKGFDCRIMDGQFLTQELYANYRELVPAFLGLPIDTGQIVDKNIFIKEYSNGIGKFACPLDNEFMFRDNEIAEILSLMTDKDFIIVTGQPGIGKTKIALEAGERFCKQNPEYVFKCISDKSESLLSDLNLNISQNNKTVLFIDDANRIEYFKQIVAFNKSFDLGQLKLLITVRDYAFNEVYPILPTGTCEKICIGRMDDKAILEIVKNALGINNESYLDAINNIAKGSPRLALMAGKIAVEKQSIESLSNLATLFSEYYKPIFSRMQKYGFENFMKTLSILAILGPTNLDDFLVKGLCSIFGITQQVFNHTINDLDKLEIINRYDSGFIKIAEQNFRFFIFHSEVIRKNTSAIEQIFSLCYKEKAPQLKENIVSVANLFGVDELMAKISNCLSVFLSNLPDDNAKISFLKDYWMLIQDDTMAFVASAILRADSQNMDNTNYAVNYDVDQFAFESSRNKLLDLIADSFNYCISNLGNMIRFALEYVRLNPGLAPQLSWHIENSFGITIEDINYGLYRHRELLNILNEGMKQNKPLEKELFWKHINQFLKTEHNYIRPTYRRAEIRICNLFIGDYKSVLNLHKIIWEMVERFFDSEYFRESICTTSFYGKKGSKLPSLDAKAICTIIKKHASPSEFNDCWMVDEFARRTRHIRSVQSDINLLSDKYHNKHFDFYITLNWYYLNGKLKEVFDYKTHGFRKAKELHSNFTFNTVRAATYFFKRFLSLWNLHILNKENLLPSLSSIISINLKSDFRIGAHLLNLALSSQIDRINLYPLLNQIMGCKAISKYEQIQTIKKIVIKNKCNRAFNYILSFYEIISIEYLQKKDCEIILSGLDIVENGAHININPSQFLKMRLLEDRWFNTFIEHIFAKNHNGSKISMESFNDLQWIDAIDNVELKEKTYLQQLALSNHFDYKRTILHKILLSRPSFIVDFAKKANVRHEHKLGKIIWSIPNIENSIAYILNRIDSWATLSEHFPIEWEYVFFDSGVNEEYKHRIKTFIKMFFNESKNKDQAFRIARNFSHPLYEELVLSYIESASTDDFMDIDWTRSTCGITFINCTYGEILKVRWEELLEIVNESNNLKRFPIIAKIKQKIKQAEESTKKDNERDEIFGR